MKNIVRCVVNQSVKKQNLGKEDDLTRRREGFLLPNCRKDCKLERIVLEIHSTISREGKRGAKNVRREKLEPLMQIANCQVTLLVLVTVACVAAGVAFVHRVGIATTRQLESGDNPPDLSK